jgi:general secretion pathway protein G
MTKRFRTGLGLVDLIVALAMIALLSAYALGVVIRSRETDNRVQCARNMRMIGQALLLYANENKGMFPRTRFKPDAGRWTAYTGWQSPDPFDPEKGTPPEINDVTAPLFLLIRTQDITSEPFVCPSGQARRWDFAPLLDAKDGKSKPVTALDRSNFPSPAFLSYSYANAYPSRAAIAAGYKLNNTVGAEFAQAADMNPGGKSLGALTLNSARQQMMEGNSLNHAREGQNVLYGDGHVEFVSDPFTGVRRDNIYTVSGSDDGSKPNSATIIDSPRGPADSVLLPTAQDKGDEQAGKFSAKPADAKPGADWASKFETAKFTVAKSHVATLSTALEAFEIDNGRYPTNEEGLAALSQKPANLTTWKGPYLKGPAPKDPWDNAYAYRHPGVHNKNGFDISSNGPDGKPDTDDDVSNWSR